MAENILPNQSTTSLIVNSRLIHRPPQSIPKFLENFEEIPLKEKRDDLNQNFQISYTRSQDQNNKIKDINLTNLQVNQSLDGNRNATYLRSSLQKKKIFEESYLNSSKQNLQATVSAQNYKRQRTFSTQIYDFAKTENSFNQVNQSLNVQSFNQNRIHLLSFQDEETIPQVNVQQEKENSQIKMIQDILVNFKQEIMKEQSNALDHLRYFVNSNEQKITQLTDQHQKIQNINMPQVTLSKLNQLSQIKTDMTQKIQQQISSQLGDRLLKIEENQSTLYEYTKKIKSDLVTYFNESLNNIFENTIKVQIDSKIDSFSNQMQEKILSFESQQSTIISQQSQESGYGSIDAEKKQKEYKDLENKCDSIKEQMDSILNKLDQKADITSLQEQFNGVFGEKVDQINEDIKQINNLKEQQKQIQQNLIQMQQENLEKIENIKTNFKQQEQVQEDTIINQQQTNNNQFMMNLDNLLEKVKYLNQLHFQLMESKKLYDEKQQYRQDSLSQNEENLIENEQFQDTSQEQEQIHELIVSQNDLDNFITMTIDDEKRYQTREPNPYRKSSKMQDSQLIQKEIQEESNLFRYSTIHQNENSNQLQEIHNILSKNQNIISKPPKQQPKIVFKRKKLSESKVESYQNATNYNSQVADQHNEFPNQEMLTFKNIIPCKIVNSLMSSPSGPNKESLFNSQQKVYLNQTNQLSNTKSSFRQSLDNFNYSSSRKVQTQENQSPMKEEQTQPISLSQYYKLQINRRSCDFSAYSKSFSLSQEKNIFNINQVDKFLNEDHQYKPSQRVNTVPSQPESNSMIDDFESRSNSKNYDKNSIITELKQSYLETKIKNIHSDITKLPIKFPKQNSKSPTLVGVDTPQEAKSDLKKRIIEQKHKKEGNKYLIPSINLNNLQIQILGKFLLDFLIDFSSLFLKRMNKKQTKITKTCLVVQENCIQNKNGIIILILIFQLIFIIKNILINTVIMIFIIQFILQKIKSFFKINEKVYSQFKGRRGCKS